MVLPSEKVAVTPPTRLAVPLPIEGAVVPVVGALSGVGLLKFHCAIVAAVAQARLAESAAIARSFPFMLQASPFEVPIGMIKRPTNEIKQAQIHRKRRMGASQFLDTRNLKSPHQAKPR